ncbi:MAG: hypothetical protein ACW980_22515 [Promethearchaeota archaeon]|jgi:hypothetical protein
MAKDKEKGSEIVKTEKITNRELIRKSFIDVFVAIGGIDHLQEFALENPRQFYTLMVKLFPESKITQADNIPKHETFIQMIINENKHKEKNIDKPHNIIDLPIDNTNVT